MLTSASVVIIEIRSNQEAERGFGENDSLRVQLILGLSKTGLQGGREVPQGQGRQVGEVHDLRRGLFGPAARSW